MLNNPLNRFNDEEADILVTIQQHAPAAAQPVARALSYFGEHALGWFATSGIGTAVAYRRGDRVKTRQWAAVGVSAFISHAASVVIKRIFRRQRPIDPRITVAVRTPSTLSFPSSHSTSSTAALVAIARLTGSPVPLVGVPVMMVSRMVSGVHYPTDTIVGAAIGALSAGAVTEIERRTR